VKAANISLIPSPEKKKSMHVIKEKIIEKFLGEKKETRKITS
jgi:hypothetical protein